MAMDGSNIGIIPVSGNKKSSSIHSLAANLGFETIQDLSRMTYGTFRKKSSGIKNIPEGFGYSAATRIMLQVLLGEKYTKILKKHHEILSDNPSAWTMMFSQGKEETYPGDVVHLDIVDITEEQIGDICSEKAFLIPDLDFSAPAKIYLYYPGNQTQLSVEIPESYCDAISDILFGYRHQDPLVLLDPKFRSFGDKYPNHPVVRRAMQILKEKTPQD